MAQRAFLQVVKLNRASRVPAIVLIAVLGPCLDFVEMAASGVVRVGCLFAG